jgi:YD repeat-containing protein
MLSLSMGQLYRQCPAPVAAPLVSPLEYDYRNNLVREVRDDNPFNWYRWQYDSAGRLLVKDGTLPSGAGMRLVIR